MSQIIRIDLRTRWGDPVRVRAPDGRVDCIIGPGDALAFLVAKWKGHKGLSYRTARRSCQGALRGEIGTALARAHFTTACMDADILE
ncbi:DUF982 domain-containing protein [Rhizobium sp. PL01]|uniref:DUF982 domain-containing protein n=1 Tax=Rhizobium sp. PL01 TaxID=3085631 RepID=UPI003991D4CA